VNALVLVFAALGVFVIGYRYYGLFIARRVLGINDSIDTPAVAMADGHDYQKTSRYVLFGHHFAAISAAGPLLGPVLAAQFGYLPGALWIIFGAVLGGAVHDMVTLFASVRYKGRGLAAIAEAETGRTAGVVAAVSIYFILSLALAGLTLAVISALVKSAWGAFTLFATVPIALIMGLYMYKLRPGDVRGASVIGVALFFAAVFAGPYVVENPALSRIFSLSRGQLAIIIPLYGFFASVLPVWLLLCPRDYLSSYLKIGTIAMLAVGIALLHPTLQMPAVTPYATEGGPVIPGRVFPFVFITIACGAISGFHSIIASGTTPKMIAGERDIPFIGFGAMLMEGFVAIMALIAACVLVPADYFAINTTSEVYRTLGMTPVHLPEISAAVGEDLRSRPGGAVSLAVGMAYIFSSIRGMERLMAYWYHFAIMFEALFILTAIDTGTRVGRFFLQELLGKAVPALGRQRWMPGIIVTSALFIAPWAWLVHKGDIATVWPVFGLSNQLLSVTALTVCTTMLIRTGKARYAWITLLPAAAMTVVTMTAGYESVMSNYLPNGNYPLAGIAVFLMALLAVTIAVSVRRWFALLSVKVTVKDKFGDMVLETVDE
jgi:carbon starvation protein